ncbi:MAG TPA: PadR family transcriptional regulator [Terriglobales bacterium]|nr:PadR family transcriptional regulator [Terriglobales bacterium]
MTGGNGPGRSASQRREPGAPEINGGAEKWEVQLRKGCLELAILASLWSGRLYGLEILRRLETDSDLIVSEGTAYPLLSRLKSIGLVDSEWVESDGGHPRKYYRLTAAGKQRALEMAAVWREFSSSMSKLLTPLAREKAGKEK